MGSAVDDEYDDTGAFHRHEQLDRGTMGAMERIRWRIDGHGELVAYGHRRFFGKWGVYRACDGKGRSPKPRHMVSIGNG